MVRSVVSVTVRMPVMSPVSGVETIFISTWT